MGERLLCKQEVIGSIPFTSTTDRTTQSVVRVEAAAAVPLHRESSRCRDAGSGDELLIFDREMTEFAQELECSWVFDL